MLTPVIGLALLAGQFLSRLTDFNRWGWVVGLVVIGVSGLQSARVSALALDRYPGDARNPYFYEQAPRSLLRLPVRLDLLQAASPHPLKVAVVSPEHAWPLPWYLRGRDNIGYFPVPPRDWETWNVVIWDDQLGQAPKALEAFAIAELYGLRPNVLLYTFIDAPTWEAVFPPLPPALP
jgi:hypothetical protein